MATYKGIKGFKVQSLASDPTASESSGKVWYNTTGNVLKYTAEGTGAWSSGGAMVGTKYGGGAGGTQTAGLVAAGAPSDGTASTYDGASWTAINVVNNNRAGVGGSGTTTAAVIFGGSPSPAVGDKTETYNGSTWTEVADLVTAGLYLNRGIGTQTATLCVAGAPQAVRGLLNESWDGTSWTEIAEINTARYAVGASGIQTAALVFAGKGPGVLAVTEKWDGTTWTEVADLNNARGEVSGCGATDSAALCYGGTGPSPGDVSNALTEKWDGTSWTELAVMANSAYGRTSIGTSSLALAGGGSGGPTPFSPNIQTEEWNDPNYTITTVTTS